MPSGISNSSVTNVGFLLSWNASTADFAIKYYKVVIKKKINNTLVAVVSNLTLTSTNFSGLESSTDYSVEISAESSIGVFSDVATHEVKTEEGIHACTNFQLTPFSF